MKMPRSSPTPTTSVPHNTDKLIPTSLPLCPCLSSSSTRRLVSMVAVVLAAQSQSALASTRRNNVYGYHRRDYVSSSSSSSSSDRSSSSSSRHDPSFDHPYNNDNNNNNNNQQRRTNEFHDMQAEEDDDEQAEEYQMPSLYLSDNNDDDEEEYDEYYNEQEEQLIAKVAQADSRGNNHRHHDLWQQHDSDDHEEKSSVQVAAIQERRTAKSTTTIRRKRKIKKKKKKNNSQTTLILPSTAKQESRHEPNNQDGNNNEHVETKVQTSIRSSSSPLSSVMRDTVTDNDNDGAKPNASGGETAMMIANDCQNWSPQPLIQSTGLDAKSDASSIINIQEEAHNSKLPNCGAWQHEPNQPDEKAARRDHLSTREPPLFQHDDKPPEKTLPAVKSSRPFTSFRQQQSTMKKHKTAAFKPQFSGGKSATPKDSKPAAISRHTTPVVAAAEPTAPMSSGRVVSPKPQNKNKNNNIVNNNNNNNNNNSLLYQKEQPTPWIRKFLAARPKDYLLPVPRDYLLDNFNLVRLAPVVEHLATLKQKELATGGVSPNLEQQTYLQPDKDASLSSSPIASPDDNSHKQHPYALYRQALDLILQQDDTSLDREPSLVVQYAAEVLYTLIHARFVVSTRGLDTICRRLVLHSSSCVNRNRYLSNSNSNSNSNNSYHHQPLFGRCPRLSCGGMPLLPCGLSDDYGGGDGAHNSHGNACAKRYCCNCRETWNCFESKVDGSAWGTSVCHLLLMVYGKEKLFPSHFAVPYKENNQSTASNTARPARGRFVVDLENGAAESNGRIFGFPVHPSAALS